MISTAKRALILASFADMVSGSDDTQRSGHNAGASVLPSPHTHARQATLHTAHDSAHCLAGSFPGPYAKSASTNGVLKLRRTIPGLHGKRVVYSMPLERARNP